MASLPSVKAAGGASGEPAPTDGQQGRRRRRTAQEERGAHPSLLTRLLLLCPQVCGGRCLLQRRAAHTLRRARAHLLRLAREVDAAADTSAPLEHVRAAAQHMAVVERWLHSSARSGTASFPLSAAESMARARRRELGFASGLAWSGSGRIADGGDAAAALCSAGDLEDEDDARHFQVLFSPSAGEVLAQVVPCLARSGSFRHPGKLYLSTARVCFHSCVMGGEILFGVPWSSISQVRLLPAESTQLHRVRFSFRKSLEFDGSVVERLDVRLFDTASLGHVHRFATFFIGSGLFGNLGSAEWAAHSAGSLTEEEGSAFADTPMHSGTSPVFHGVGGSVKDIIAGLEGQAIVWELERRTTIFHEDWRAPFLPHDGQKQMKWVTLSDGYKVHPFISRSEDDGAMAAMSSRPPIPEVEVLGHYRPCVWHVVVDEDGDCDGWQYAVDFYAGPEYWRPVQGTFSHVRRRKWKPTFGRAIAPAEGLVHVDVAGDESPDAAGSRMGRPSTTMLAEKGLLAVSAVPLVDAFVGALPLDALARALEVDNWQDPEALMASYFTEFGAQDVEIGPWASGQGAAARVKGRVRSAEMRMPVPPGPLCPKETRIASTWHVLTTSAKVVLESVTMSLDVPYGTSFNVITCDTFTVDEQSGQTRMVRTCGVEWLRSTWARSIVEANLPGEITRIGARWAELIRERGPICAARCPPSVAPSASSSPSLPCPSSAKPR